jgi:flagellar biosynthetic protein FlhB
LKSEFTVLTGLARSPLPAATEQLVAAVFRLAVWASLALVGIAAIDYLKSYVQHEKQIKMSRQELKDEMKQHEGDPAVRAKQRARARELAKRGLMKEIQSATVVVANPTHISIALRYSAQEGAPVVCAKGVDEVAMFIRELAKEHDVPVVRNVPLARALNDRVRVGKSIPVDLYTAVAEVLAYVYRMKGQGIRA